MTTLKKISEEFSKGNFGFAYNYFSEDMQWNIVGDKIVKGKENVITFCNKMQTEMDSSKLINTNIIVENKSIAIEGYCEYKNAKGESAQVQYCDVYRFENGEIKSITSYCITSIIKS